MLGSSLSDTLNLLLEEHDWISQLAGILPLSAIIDFVNVSEKLHILQLNGTCPLWSWPITPATARLLLYPLDQEQVCCILDTAGRSLGLLAMDGRYGDEYVVSNPETVRMCINAGKSIPIVNEHGNMKIHNRRTQILDIIHVTSDNNTVSRLRAWPKFTFLLSLKGYSLVYHGILILGWIFWLGCVSIATIMQCYLALVFLLLMPCSDLMVKLMHGAAPMGLLEVDDSNPYTRVVVVAENWNSNRWTVFYGQSTILNSLLNRPLKLQGKLMSSTGLRAIRALLRVLILGQWALVLGAAASQDWNAYLISMWILFCILIHTYCITPALAANIWMTESAEISMHRYRSILSSRRALVNALIALNPDTFPDKQGPVKDTSRGFRADAFRWVDRVIAESDSRDIWEVATLEAMQEVLHNTASASSKMDFSEAVQDFAKDAALSPEWNSAFPLSTCYWRPFILEGIYMAGRIRAAANLPGRAVTLADVA